MWSYFYKKNKHIYGNAAIKEAMMKGGDEEAPIDVNHYPNTETKRI
jgi:hypothetical protein